MNDVSDIQLINVLRSAVDQVQKSPNFDQASPGVKELKRALLEQILRLLAANRACEAPGAPWNSLTRP
jgi:hypothetical protein